MNQTEKLAKARAGICPYCGRGAFLVVASHVTRMHDLDRVAFRDDIGAYLYESLVDHDSDYYRKRVADSTRIYAWQGLEAPTKRNRTFGRGKRWTADVEKRLAKQREQHRHRSAAARADLVTQYQTGRSVYDLAAERSITVKTVRQYLVEGGLSLPDGRADPDRPMRTSYPKADPWFCTVDDCDRVGLYRTLGMCQLHYQRHRRAETKETQ